MATHNTTTWFSNGFLSYFENEFKRNTIGRLKLPASTIGNMTEKDQTSAAFAQEFAKLTDNIANIWIDAVMRNKIIMKYTEFNQFEDDTRSLLREAIAEAVQHAIQNKNIWERINASTISYSGTFATDTTAWLLSSDMFGKIAWNLIENSGINDYEWVEDEYTLYKMLPNGNVKIVKEII